jgi:hypothetical protein
MNKCRIEAMPVSKVRDVFASPDTQKELLKAKQRSERVLVELREARRVEPGQMKEPFNL